MFDSFFFNDTATTEIYTLSLHDALPIYTASLFPGTAALEEHARKVVANFVPKLDAWRLTFTLPLINHARRICFLVNGDKDRKSTRLNSSHANISYAVFCLKKK